MDKDGEILSEARDATRDIVGDREGAAYFLRLSFVDLGTSQTGGGGGGTVRCCGGV